MYNKGDRLALDKQAIALYPNQMDTLMIQQYSEATLKLFSISQLRDICRQLSISPRRSKADCVADILSAQPQLVAQAELEVHVEEKSAEVAPQTCATCPHFKAHNDGTDKGWCNVFDSFARNHHQQTDDCVQNFPEEEEEEEEEVADYLFHNDPTPTPSQTPQVGDVTILQGYILRCTAIGGTHAIVWDVYENNRPVDRIYMGWDCRWRRSLSYTPYFNSIQEAIADLAVAQAFINRGFVCAV
jgi:hypothetical protein